MAFASLLSNRIFHIAKNQFTKLSSHRGQRFSHPEPASPKLTLASSNSSGQSCSQFPLSLYHLLWGFCPPSSLAFALALATRKRTHRQRTLCLRSTTLYKAMKSSSSQALGAHKRSASLRSLRKSSHETKLKGLVLRTYLNFWQVIQDWRFGRLSAAPKSGYKGSILSMF